MKANPHEIAVANYDDATLNALIADIGKRNLRDYRDNETRWLAERCSAARRERKARKLAGKATA